MEEIERARDVPQVQPDRECEVVFRVRLLARVADALGDLQRLRVEVRPEVELRAPICEPARGFERAHLDEQRDVLGRESENAVAPIGALGEIPAPLPKTPEREDLARSRLGVTARRVADERTRALFLSKIPARRIAEPEDVGPLAVYLASSASDLMTGQTVYLDGGQTISW